eukprot:SAG31_NODE_3541_length_4143_cov_2.731949_3_plen_359_part_00
MGKPSKPREKFPNTCLRLDINPPDHSHEKYAIAADDLHMYAEWRDAMVNPVAAASSLRRDQAEASATHASAEGDSQSDNSDENIKAGCDSDAILVSVREAHGLQAPAWGSLCLAPFATVTYEDSKLRTPHVKAAATNATWSETLVFKHYERVQYSNCDDIVLHVDLHSRDGAHDALIGTAQIQIPAARRRTAAMAAAVTAGTSSSPVTIVVHDDWVAIERAGHGTAGQLSIKIEEVFSPGTQDFTRAVRTGRDGEVSKTGQGRARPLHPDLAGLIRIPSDKAMLLLPEEPPRTSSFSAHESDVVTEDEVGATIVAYIYCIYVPYIRILLRGRCYYCSSVTYIAAIVAPTKCSCYYRLQ